MSKNEKGEQAFNTAMTAHIEDEERYLEQFQESANIFNESLPYVAREFQKSAVKVSHMNEIPAAISFFTILGQVVKDFIIIPNGRNHEDTRIHFCWVQTSGTGKSTLWNFVGPVANKTFEKINQNNKHPPFIRENVPMTRTFGTFGVTDYTDSVLIGGYKEEIDDDGNKSMERKAGLLEGSGLAHWDEFEYSGIFKQTQHQEKAIVYLNTLMNSLSGESWIISKALSSFGDGGIMECFCERSVLAMTYPPSNLNEVMAEKGVLQRMLLYVWNVPEFIQDKMRTEQNSKAGTIEEVNQPIDRFADSLYTLYELVREQYTEKGANPLQTMTYTDDFRDVLQLEYQNMRNYLQNTRHEVAAIASNFTTRLTKILIKLSVLCSVASAPSIKNKDERFIVTGHNVRQAATIIRQCYMTLVDWLERSLKVKKASVAENSLEPLFIAVYDKMDKDNEGFVNKTLLLTEVRTKAKKSRAQIFRHYEVVRHKFIEMKSGRYTYIKLIRSDDE